MLLRALYIVCSTVTYGGVSAVSDISAEHAQWLKSPKVGHDILKIIFGLPQEVPYIITSKPRFFSKKITPKDDMLYWVKLDRRAQPITEHAKLVHDINSP